MNSICICNSRFQIIRLHLQSTWQWQARGRHIKGIITITQTL